MQTNRKDLEECATFAANVRNDVECEDKHYGGFYGYNKPNNPFEKCLTSAQPEDCKQKVYDDFQKCREIFNFSWETKQKLEDQALSSIKYRLKNVVSRQKDAFYSAPTFWTRFRNTHISKCPTAPVEDHKKCVDHVYNEFKNSIPENATPYIPSQKEVESYFAWRNEARQKDMQRATEIQISNNEARNQQRCKEIYYIKSRPYSSTIFGKFNQCLTANDPQKCKDEIHKQYQQCLKKA